MLFALPSSSIFLAERFRRTRLPLCLPLGRLHPGGVARGLVSGRGWPRSRIPPLRAYLPHGNGSIRPKERIRVRERSSPKRSAEETILRKQARSTRCGRREHHAEGATPFLAQHFVCTTDRKLATILGALLTDNYRRDCLLDLHPALFLRFPPTDYATATRACDASRRKKVSACLSIRYLTRV